MVVFHDATPMSVDHGRTFFTRTDAVFPVVFVREATAWPAKDGDLNPLERRYDVVPDAARVRNRALLSHPDTFVNTMAQVLRELAINVAVDGVTRFVGMDDK